MKKEHVLVGKFALLNLIVFMGQAFTYVLMIPYFTSLGYNEVTQGLIFALGAVLTIVGQFTIGYLCDKFKTDKKIFVILYLVFVIIDWLFYSYGNSPVALVILWAALVCSLFQVTQGVLDTWVVESDKYCLDNYGWIRAFGAIGWAIGSPLCSFFFEKWGYTSLGNGFVLFTVLTLVITLFVKDVEKVEREEKLKFSDIKALFVNPNFLLITLVLLCLYMVVSADSYTPIYKMIALGEKLGQTAAVTNSQINFKWAYQAMWELPLFFFGGWFVKKFGGVKVLFVVTIMMFLRFVLYAFATEPMHLVWVSTLQAVTFPFIMICSKQLIDEESPVYLRAGGQQISSSIYIGVSSLLTPVICSFLVKQFSHNLALYAIASVCIIPLCLLLVYQRTKKAK